MKDGDRIVIDEENSQRQWQLPQSPWGEAMEKSPVLESVSELIKKIDHSPQEKEVRMELDIPGRLYEKYKNYDVVREWLDLTWPSMECFEALLLSREGFIALLWLNYGERYQEVLAREMLRAEARQSLKKGLGKEEEKKIVKELQMTYKNAIKNLRPFEIRRYAKSKDTRKELSAEELEKLMTRTAQLLIARFLKENI
jgi:hypothetical protein